MAPVIPMLPSSRVEHRTIITTVETVDAPTGALSRATFRTVQARVESSSERDERLVRRIRAVCRIGRCWRRNSCRYWISRRYMWQARPCYWGGVAVCRCGSSGSTKIKTSREGARLRRNRQPEAFIKWSSTNAIPFSVPATSKRIGSMYVRRLNMSHQQSSAPARRCMFP
jgi:hypothetical protein